MCDVKVRVLRYSGVLGRFSISGALLPNADGGVVGAVDDMVAAISET